MKSIVTFLIMFFALTNVYAQFIERSRVEWWENGNADSIESNWYRGKYNLTIDNDQYSFYYPDTLTLVEAGEFIFPYQNYLKPLEYSDPYCTNMELIIMSRTLKSIGIIKMSDSPKEYVRLFSFKEINPIFTEYVFDSDSLKYYITDGFTWTHGKVIKNGSIGISQKESLIIKAKLEGFVRDNLKIRRSNDITDFVIEFKISGTYAIIKLSHMDYSENKDVVKFIKQLEKIIDLQLIGIK